MLWVEKWRSCILMPMFGSSVYWATFTGAAVSCLNCFVQLLWQKVFSCTKEIFRHWKLHSNKSCLLIQKTITVTLAPGITLLQYELHLANYECWKLNVCESMELHNSQQYRIWWHCILMIVFPHLNLNWKAFSAAAASASYVQHIKLIF